MGAGAFLVASYIPYMVAMQRDEASIVASLYRLSPIFVFVLAYALLGESLRPRQMIGGLLTIAGSISIVAKFEPRRRVPGLITFFLMAASCGLNASAVVIFKLVALDASFWRSVFWEYMGAGVFSIALAAAIPSYRQTLLALVRSGKARALVSMTLGGEMLNLLANLTVNFAGLVAPLALVSIVTGLHPVFLFAYGILFTLFAPTFGREQLALHHAFRKVIAIGVMCVGIVITFTD